MKILSTKNRFLSWVKNHKLYSFLIALIILAGGTFGYNKYLDWRNVQDMKALLYTFEKLKNTLTETSIAEYYIEASCGTGSEKFSQLYSCRIVLPGKESGPTNYYGLEVTQSTDEDCEILEDGKENFKNALRCDIDIRKSNIKTAETIFYKYDTSPGRAF